MEKNIKKFLLPLIGITTLAGSITAVSLTANETKASAWYGSKTEMKWEQVGKKEIFNKFSAYTGFKGKVWAKKYFWYWDRTGWTGISKSRIEYNDSSLVTKKLMHNIKIWLNGSGQPDYSTTVGVNAGISTEGPSLGLGISGTFHTNPAHKMLINSYLFEDTNDDEIYYTYTGMIYSWSYVGISTNSTFQAKNRVVIVDSEGDEYIDKRQYISVDDSPSNFVLKNLDKSYYFENDLWN